MRKLTKALLVALLVAAVTSCSDEEAAPNEPAKTELISEVRLTLMRRQDSTFQSAVITDPDGPGPLPWQAQVGTIMVLPNASYTATMTLINATVSPTVDITPLINARKLQHRFFYTVAPDGGVLATDLTIDSNSAEYGEAFAIHVPTGVESREWTLRVLLSHYEGDAKGNGLTPAPLTDVDVTFLLGT